MSLDRFSEVKKNFGFGCMRLPMAEGAVDTAEFSAMVDAYLAAGFNYFDTAHGYLEGKSEPALKACLTSRYPRESYVLTDKLTDMFFKCQEDIRPLFEQQLEACGVDYFDFYLMHAQTAERFAYYKSCRAYETALELQAEGKFRHFGISIHDSAEVLRQILTEYPQIEVVQIQLNYIDFEDPAVQSRKLLETCREFGKAVLVMEPVKGGQLVNLPEEAAQVFAELGGSPAQYAIRFAAGFPEVLAVLSGMSNMEQLQDNIGFMKDYQPLSAEEAAAVDKVRSIFTKLELVPCTACHYCTDVCPQQINIPEIFACLNKREIFHSWSQTYYYRSICTTPGHRASDCLHCGACEEKCPQHLPIREYLEKAAAALEKKKEAK